MTIYCQRVCREHDRCRCPYPARFVARYGFRTDAEILVCGYHKRAYTNVEPLKLTQPTGHAPVAGE